MSPVDCAEFRQTCTCSQEEKHVGALGGVGVSNTSAPQVHRPEPSSRAAPPLGQKEVSGVELKITHCSDTEGFPGNMHREQDPDVSLVRVNSDAFIIIIFRVVF